MYLLSFKDISDGLDFQVDHIWDVCRLLLHPDEDVHGWDDNAPYT